MTILTVGVRQTPDSQQGNVWDANLIYVDHRPNTNIFIPRLIHNERMHSTFMQASSDVIVNALKRTAVVYIADTGVYLDELPSNPTGLRVAFIHGVIEEGDSTVRVECRTGVNWEILVVSMFFKWYKPIVAHHLPVTDQLIVHRLMDIDAQPLDRSNMYIVKSPLNGVKLYVTPQDSEVPCTTITRENLFAQIKHAEEAYSNIVRVDTIQQMNLVKQTLHRNSVFVVANAFDQDASVGTGMAMYLYNVVSGVITKIYEVEGSDVVISLDNFDDKPATSTEFDELVRTKHTHSLLPYESGQAMEGLSVNTGGNLVFNTVPLENGLDFHTQDW